MLKITIITVALALMGNAVLGANKPTATVSKENFAPVAESHELAPIWNDPEFTRRLIGSYGFASDAEPRMTPEEQALYRDKIVPLLREDPKKAIPALAGAIKPSSSALFDFTLGNIYFQGEDLTNAVKYFRDALSKFPDYRRAQKNLAFALVRDGKYKEAVQPLIRTVSLGGGDGKVFGLLGFTLTSQGRYASAEGAYEQALVFEPENFDYKQGLVKCAVATSNFDRALALLTELIEQYPDKDSLWTLQANIYIQKEQPAKAAVALEMLKRMGKASVQNLFLLGDLYMTQEARDLALESYLLGIQKDGGQSPGKALRPAQILVSRGAYEEAGKLFATIRNSAKLSGEEEMKLLKLEAKTAIATGHGEKAIASLEEISRKNPLDGEALLLAGDYYSKNGQPEKAAFRYETAATLPESEPDALVKHAQLLVQSRKYVQAAELLRRAQKVKPRDNVQTYLEKVEQLARAGRS